MNSKIRRATTRMQRAAQAELRLRQAFNSAMRAYLCALEAVDRDDQRVSRSLKRAVNATGRAHARAERTKARTKAVFQTLNA